LSMISCTRALTQRSPSSTPATAYLRADARDGALAAHPTYPAAW